MNKLAVVLLFVCLTALAMAAQTKFLVAKSRVSTSVVAGGSYALPTACDEQGRLYVKLVKPGTPMEGPLLRLSDKGSLEAEFDTSGAVTNVFAVRPKGGVAMVHLDGATKVVDNFGPDGKRESSVRLESPPKPFFPSQIAVFRSGEILLAGVQYHPGYTASTAIYDPAGHLVKQFVLEGDAEIERAIEVGDARYTRAPREGNEPVSRSVAITGDDGFVYLMRATSPATVYVISATGDVVHKIVVSAPTDTGLPEFGLRVDKNKLAIKFSRTCGSTPGIESCEGAIYTVVDASTGQRFGDYQAGEDVAGPIACYAPDPERFFTFSMSDQHHLEIVQAAAK
jgi:hypothetical protein